MGIKGSATIELTNAFGNTEIENHFSKHNRVIYVHIEACAVATESLDKMIVRCKRKPKS